MTTAVPLKPTEALQDELFASVRQAKGDTSFLLQALETDGLLPFILGMHNEDGRSLLHAAVAASNIQAAKLLLERGANVSSVDESGWTALHIAASSGLTDFVGLLLRSTKGDLEKKEFIENLTDSGARALHYAASKGHLETVELLLSHGADVNAKGYGNHTALTRAVSAGREAVVHYLLTVPGIDLTVKETTSGDNLLHIAVNSERADIYWEIAQAAPQLEDETNAEGKTPVGSASRDFMKKLEYIIKQSRGDE